MLDCYINMTTKQDLTNKLKQLIINCYDDWYSLGIKTMVSVSDATEIGGNYSIKLSINDIKQKHNEVLCSNKDNSLCYNGTIVGLISFKSLFDQKNNIKR